MAQSAAEKIFQKRRERHERRADELGQCISSFFEGKAEIGLARRTILGKKPLGRFPVISTYFNVAIKPKGRASTPAIKVKLTSTASTYNPSTITRNMEWGATVVVQSSHQNFDGISRMLHEHLKRTMLASHVLKKMGQQK